jgi:hypothetical protein
MKAMSDEEVDEMFRQKLQSYEDAPSALVWKNISNELQPQKQIKSSPPRIWIAAASLILLACLALLFLPGKPPVKLQASQSTELKPVEHKGTPPAVTPKLREPKGILFLERLASMRVESDKHVKDYKKSGKAISENIAHITQVQQTEIQTPNVTAEISQREEPPVLIANELNVENTSPASVLALAVPEQEDPVPHKGKIRSLGDIVNFVVRQVDPRKEKIIEFTNHDEGSSVSSINLGLLKIKTKQNEAKLN